MSLKKRMFRSNMMILLSALVLLMLVVGIVGALFDDVFFKDFKSIDNSKLDSNVNQVIEIVQQVDTVSLQLVEEKLREYNYKILVLKDGKIVYGDNEKHWSNVIGNFKLENHTNSELEIFYHQNITAVGKYSKENESYILAVHFTGEEWWISYFRNSFTTFFIILILIGFATIIILLLLSSFFTRKMRKSVMEPLEALARGAERIRNENLEENIIYHGDEEFENVCNTFNAMQKTMLQDRKQRIRYEKARTDMVTGISHDLRTPLTSIQGYIKGILDGVANTEEKKIAYLNIAYESTKDMNVLLQKLFDFSRMESGQMPFHMIKGDLLEYTASYVAQKEVSMDLEKTQIILEGAESVMSEIYMDIEQVRRILDNLLENSKKYADADPLIIHILIYEENEYVVMEWMDNGRGVPKEKLGSIFERFYRCDEARSKKGSGVGLYVVKYIIEQHGGHIIADNLGGLRLKLSFPKEDLR